MRQSRFTEQQIIAILAEQECGMKTAEICRKYGISQNTFYKWEAKFGGPDVFDARKLERPDLLLRRGRRRAPRQAGAAPR